MAAEPDGPDNRVIILNGFSYEEIDTIMRTLKSVLPEPRDLIFAKTTPTSLQMKLADLIQDISEDHEYLRKNPPKALKKAAEDQGSSSGTDPDNPDASSRGGR